MRHAYDHLIAFALEQPWALTEEMRRVIAGVLARRMVGQDGDPDQIAAAVKMRKVTEPTAGNGVAVIPVYGVIAPRMNLMTEMSGGTSYDLLTSQLHEAVATNPKAIVFDVDSPGGNVAGATEFAREVLKARTRVPIIAQANHLMASAAFWLGACATEVIASPSSLVGSIGVYTIYQDMSAALEQLGIKREVIAAGKFKGEGVDGGALTDDARAHRQSIVDGYYGKFVGDVAKGRGVTVEVVTARYGQGRVVAAGEALAAGMVDRIATLSETVSRFLDPAVAGTGIPRATAPATAQELSGATAQERAAISAQEFDFLRLRLAAEFR
jgi:signal peptide peptidase SppA